MMKSITVSAPGKLMLFGEHAVVYGHPCIVTAVGQRMFVTVTSDKSQVTSSKPRLRIDAPDVDVVNYEKPLEDLGKGDIPKGARFIEIAVKNFLDFLLNPLPSRERAGVRVKQFQDDKLGLQITTKSEFSSLFGFGSSSASTVCVIKALSELFEIKLSSKEIFDLAYKTVLDIQGKGSGFDVAAAIYGGTLYFVTGGEAIKQIISPCHCDPALPEKQSIIRDRHVAGAPRDDNCLNTFPLVVGYSGIKADTVTLINKVYELSKKNPELVNNIYKNIDKIVESARVALEKENWQELGRLMNENQKLLFQLGVSIDKLDAMIDAAKDAGAYGAKLSGAGGGDCMIALRQAQGKLAVEEAIEKVGGTVIDVKTNVEGVRVEENQKSEIKDQKQV